jgi:nucleotide-binding universal stress UspA family protein
MRSWPWAASWRVAETRGAPTMRILIGVDGSSQAMAGAKWVAGLPLATGDQVTVVTIARPPAVPASLEIGEFEDERLREAALRETREAGRPWAEDAADLIRGSGHAVASLALAGDPLESLRELAREVEADLVVVGPQGHGFAASMLLGSVTQGLLRAMPTAVLVAREPVSMPRRLLLATDGSPHSLAAAGYLAAFPLSTDARVFVIAVCSGSVGLTLAEERAWAEQVVTDAIEALGPSGREAQPLIRRGDPKKALPAAVEEVRADLLVTGARGLGGFGGLILGSVSQAVAMSASCSVLVVPERSTTPDAAPGR